jgi:hypothetical protein
VIEIEVQNETHQTQQCLRFSAVPRMGEGIRLLEPDGFWASYDIIDLWYQKAEYGDVWEPYIHVKVTSSEQAGKPVKAADAFHEDQQDIVDKAKKGSKPSATDQQQIVDTAKKVADILQASGGEVTPEPEEMHHS